MKYRVIRYFTDLQDNGRPYNVGDTYPRTGAKAAKKRIAELMSEKNLQGVPLIAEESTDDGTDTK